MKLVPVHQSFEEAAQRFPDRTAIIEGSASLNYCQVNESSNRLAHAISAVPSFHPGAVVALWLPAGIDYVVACLAVLKAGGIFVALDPTLPLLRKQAHLQRVQPTLAISNAVHSSAWAEGGTDIPLLPVDASGKPDNPTLVVAQNDACYIVFTSGTTGQPSAILGSGRGLSHFIEWEIAEFSLDETVRVPLLAPPTFDVSLRDIFIPLTTGGVLCIPHPETRTSVDKLLLWLDQRGITLMHCVPSLFRTLLKEMERCPDTSARFAVLRYILLAGEPLYPSDVSRWRTRISNHTEFVNLYGPSETTLAKAFYRIADMPEGSARMLPVGKPLPDTTLLVLQEEDPCDIGEIGELHILTAYPSRGYLGEPERTAERFVPNPIGEGVLYRTGDMARRLADGNVALVGRRDDQVKINGIRIELGEIEQALVQHPSIQQAAATVHIGNDHGSTLSAYFVARESLPDADLRAYLATLIPTFMHPSFFVQMDELPVNLHGKVVRRALPRPADLLYRDNPCVPPANEIESRLAEAWSQVLQLYPVGVTHTFVELGGDSLKAIQVLPRIAGSLGSDITLRDLFPRGTVRSLARLIAARKEDESAVMSRGPA